MALLKKERAALNTALSIAQSSQNPTDAAKHMPQLASLLAAVQPCWERTSDVAQRVITCNFTSPVTVNNAGVATPTNIQPIQFPSPGKVVGVKGIVIEGDATIGLFQNYVAMSVQINGDRYLITDGQVQRYAALSVMKGQPTSGDPGHEWFPLDNYVLPSDRWFSQCNVPGIGTATTVPAGIYTPVLYFLFEADFDALRLG